MNCGHRIKPTNPSRAVIAAQGGARKWPVFGVCNQCFSNRIVLAVFGESEYLGISATRPIMEAIRLPDGVLKSERRADLIGCK